MTSARVGIDGPISVGVGGPVADAPNGLDQVLVLGAELGPQPPDVHVHGARAAVEVVAPDLAQQRRAG